LRHSIAFKSSSIGVLRPTWQRAQVQISTSSARIARPSVPSIIAKRPAVCATMIEKSVFGTPGSSTAAGCRSSTE